MGQTNTSGTVVVASGHVDNGDFISGADFISSPHPSIGEDVVGGGTQFNGSGGSSFVNAGTAIDTTASGYIDLVVEGIPPLGYDDNTGGALTINAVLSSLAREDVFSGGTSVATLLTTSTTEGVDVGGTALGTAVDDAALFVGGYASGTVVNANGLEFVSGLVTGTTVSDGFEIVSDGGTAIGTTVSAHGVQAVHNGGSARDTTVDSGGFLSVDLGRPGAGGNDRKRRRAARLLRAVWAAIPPSARRHTRRLRWHGSRLEWTAA